VLDRTNQDQGWGNFVFPLVFVGIGGAVLGFALFGPWGREKSISGSIASERARRHLDGNAITSGGTQALQLGGSDVVSDNPADQLDTQWREPMKLKPASTRIGTAIGIAFVALFWNGIISVLFFPGQFGNFGWGQIGIYLFSIPFVLVGLLLILGTIYSFVAIFNPTVEIAFSSGAVPLGGQVDIAWHTFDAKRNKIQWRVVVRGEIPWAPDISEEFEFRVTPTKAPARS